MTGIIFCGGVETSENMGIWGLKRNEKRGFYDEHYLTK